MNRFKFRAYITVSYEDDDDNEKEVSFYLYNVDLNDNNYGIGITRDELRDTLFGYGFDEDVVDRIEDELQTNSFGCDYEYIGIENCYYKNPEQCIGQKDKNGKLIYEGDIVEATSLPEKCVVVWSDEETGFTLKSLKDNIYYSFYCYDKFAVIGNIHENKDLLEAKND